MYRATIFYPNKKGAKFDVDYYRKRHMPMVKKKLGRACKGIGVDYGLGGAEPNTPPTYVAIGYILTDNLEKFQAAVAKHDAEFRADLPNYTTLQPIIQINEVKL
jgi:uncharacterized protein (TIGR02118 family)